MAKITGKILHRWPLKLGLLGTLLVVIVATSAGTQFYQHRKATDLRSKYNFLSSRILEEQRGDILLNFRPLQNDYADYLRTNNLNDNVSLYFEYLPTGSSIGINEDKQSEGASLLKLPLAVSFYKLVEEGKLSLDTVVPLQQRWLNSSYGTLYKKGAGYRLSYRQAIDYALQQSDNTAALMLFEAVSQADDTNSPSILGFVDADYSTNKNMEVSISPQSYSSVLKCLYFSCYLSKDDSQAILQTLSKSVDQTRLQLYLPDTVTVAHKIGTYENQTQSDCGIVYVPKRRYLLCIMVKGQDPGASRIIGDLSQMTYQFINPETKSAVDQ